MNFLRNEKGIAMPLVLIVLIVLTLLGTALWQYSVNDVNQVVRAENKARAYYVARTGAESLARYIMSNPDQIDNILGESEGEPEFSDPQTFDRELSGMEGELQVSLSRLEDNKLEVTGIGITEGVRQEVGIILQTMPLFGDYAVVVTGNELVNFHSQMEIEGSIMAGGDVLPEDLHEDSTDWGVTRNYPFTEDDFDPVVVPVNPDVIINKIEIKSPDVYTINAGTHLEVSGPDKKDGVVDVKGRLVINTIQSKPTILVVDKFNAQANSEIIVQGYGDAEIYIRSMANLQTPITVTSDCRLTFFLAEGSEMNMQANSSVEALIYGPYNTTVFMQGNAKFYGAMIVASLSGSGTFIGQDGLLKYYRGFDDDRFKPVVKMKYWIP